ncbi:hypothetical protein PtA15_7A113 [Puccinia triticina]|uniref:Uncharacterized protein n=2 Tax=Puccinia triticina TaxID=208348 RepID=A0ABY7CQY7_9BASI|nr:uncharacterized protein PtA15_7A113 [Puccinia triticina]WAQ86387.1 hypothetical protein PtA15_7A113 [Puccinia triticina]WAR56269.1 hypothetical protein PtB15_7B115 [Puccinia triticina]
MPDVQQAAHPDRLALAIDLDGEGGLCGPLQEALVVGSAAAQKKRFSEAQKGQYVTQRDLLLDILNQLGLPYTARWHKSRTSTRAILIA